MLRDKVALVTGGSRGIGKAIAKALAREGAQVVIGYCSGAKEAQAVIQELESKGARGLAVQADVTSYKDCEKLVNSTLEFFGKIDILINNAGIRQDNILLRMTSEQWNRVINTNLNGVFNCSKAVAKAMLKQKKGGSIINIASIAGIYGNAGQTNYSAAKAGVIAFTKSLAKELGSRGITVNAVAPGFIKTEMTESLPDPVKKKALSHIPLGRFGLPEEVAQAVLFFASSASYITGQVLSIDGGLVI